MEWNKKISRNKIVILNSTCTVILIVIKSDLRIIETNAKPLSLKIDFEQEIVFSILWTNALEMIINEISKS